MKKLTHGSLSSGIGGFDLGAEENGIITKWTCEIDPLRRDILKFQNPKAKHYEDMRKVRKPPYVDIISFGFPCQDISQANPKGEGISGKKSGLWYEGWRIICAVRPQYIIIENSPILLHKGFRTILAQLASAGYDAEWQTISCKKFGLPHLRKRLFVVAYTNEVRRQTDNRFQSGKHQNTISQETSKRSIGVRSDFSGNTSWQHWGETICRVHHLDDGIPKNILYGLLEAAGDTVSPRITSWIFSRIKEAQEKNI
jgi:DNA (cytosine-5)-methyltransferase 1